MSKKLLCDNKVVIGVKGYSLQQLRLFYCMIYECKLNILRKGNIDDQITISRNAVVKIFGDLSINKSMEVVDKMPKHIKVLIGNEYKYISVFDEISLCLVSGDIDFIISESFYYKYLEELFAEFTIIDIDKFIQLRSVYGQRMYEIYRTWNSTGKVTLLKDKFREVMEVPKSYITADLQKNVIEPAINDLANVGINVAVTKNKKGRNLISYTFTYKIDNMK